MHEKKQNKENGFLKKPENGGIFMKKRVLSLLLCTAMTIGALSGCGKDAGKDEEDNEVYAYGIFEFDKKTNKKRFFSGSLTEDTNFNKNDLKTILDQNKKSKRNKKY